MSNEQKQRYTILVADDSDMNRMMLREMLKDSYDIVEAADGLQALAILQKAEQEISLILLDIVMPNMDGLEALKAIRAKNPAANVVMCSAMGQEAMVIEAIQSGAKDFIVKPFKPDRILKTVTSIVGNP